MNYKSENLDDLARELKEGVVTFEYVKKDGTARVAKGTMNEELLPEKIPDRVSFDVEVINELMKAKDIPTLEDYARENGLRVFGTIEIEGQQKYVFVPIKNKKQNEDLFTYYDVEKDAFRSFKKENFKGIIE